MFLKKCNSFFYLWLFTPTVVIGSYFPDAGVNETTIISQFEIQLTEEWKALYGIEKFESPVLIDATAKIGRSRPHLEGGQQDEILGTRPCQEGINDACYQFVPLRITDQNFTLVPEQFHDGPVGMEEMHIQFISGHLTDSCGSNNAIRIGDVAPEALPSLGEVESLNITTTSSFPAKAFVNLFIEVDVDGNYDGIVDMTLINKDPLVIQNSYLEVFPPQPFYLSSDKAIPIFDKVSSQSKPVGDLIIKAGNVHSICGNQNIEAIPEFEILAFTSQETNSKVALEWSVTDEDNIIGFNLWRARKNEEGEFIEISQITDELIPVQKIAFGATVYVYEDPIISGNVYYYGLETINWDGIPIIHLNKIISTDF